MSALGTGASVALPLALAAGTGRAIQGAANTAISQVADLSPEVARALAMDEVRQLRANLRTADRLGDELATNIGARGEIASNLQDLGGMIVEPMIAELNEILEAVAGLTQIAKDAAEFSRPVFSFLWELSEAMPIPVINELLLKWLGEFRKKEADKNVSFLDWFEKQPQPVPPGFKAEGQLEVMNVAFNEIPGLNL